jgi:hypothetical protein
MTKILVLPPGASDAAVSHGKEAFPVYREDHTDSGSRWLVEVPDHVAVPLTHNGGFLVYEHPMRRRLTGQCVPLVLHDGEEPCSVSYDGDSYEAELQELPDGSCKYVIPFPAEGVSEVLGIHPGYKILSMADHQAPPVHPDKGYEKMERERRMAGLAPLQGGGIRELDIFPPNSKPGEHPDGVANPQREAEIAEAAVKVEADVAVPAEPAKDESPES